MDRKSKCIPTLLCLLVFTALLIISLHPSPCLAKTVTLGWDPNSEPDVDGYVVYRNVGSPGPPYEYSDTLPEDELADPLNPIITLTGLSDKKEYYIAVTAYDTQGNESDFSDDVCVEIVNSVINNCSASLSPNGGSSKSGGGGGCFISSAADESHELPAINYVFIIAGLVIGYKAWRRGGWKARKLKKSSSLIKNVSRRLLVVRCNVKTTDN